MGLTIITNKESDSGLSRRTFLQGISAALGVGVAGSMAGVGSSLFDPLAAGAITGPTLPAGKPIMVAIELHGGNDSLNTVIPMSVPYWTGYYRTARPTLGIKRVNTTRPYTNPVVGDNLPAANDLGGGWALHGSLPWMANRYWGFKDVAVIHGVGENVRRDMSHFASYAFKWAGAFSGNLLNTGWMGRYNDALNPHQALGAVSMMGSHDALKSTNSPSVAMYDLANFRFNSGWPDGAPWLTQLRAMGDPTGAAPNKAGIASKAISDSFAAMDTANGITAFPAGGNGGSIAQQLSIVASLINAGIPCQTYITGLGSFDDHGSEPASHTSNLWKLNAGLANFFSLLNQTTRKNDVFVVIYSEFGRQLKQNSSVGTDHGQAGTMFVLGGGVKGGMYGTPPSLAAANLSSDSMIATTDFRAVYATMLNRLGGSSTVGETVLGRDESNNAFPDLGLWTTGPAKPVGAASVQSSGAAIDPTPVNV